MKRLCLVKAFGGRKTILVSAGTTALAVLLTIGCAENNASNPASESTRLLPRIETVSVRHEDLAQRIEMPGTVEGYETADLYAKVGGYLESISVDIGDHITKGQELAKIQVPEMLDELHQKEAEVVRAEANLDRATAGIRQAEAEVASATAAMEEAKAERSEKEAQSRFRQAEYKRVQGLVESGALVAERLDEARFQLDASESVLGAADARIRTAQASLKAVEASVDKAKTDSRAAQAEIDVAKANLQRTQTMLQYTTIRAPFDGMVAKRMVHPGAFIQPAEGNSAAKPLLTVTRTDVVRVFLDLPMLEVRSLNRGDKAVLDRVNALPDETFEGEVTRFSSSLDVASRMMKVEVDLQNADHRLLPGYYGYVTLLLEEYPQTPVVPSSALLFDGAEAYVYVVKDGTCEKREVTILYQDGIIVGIASGITLGEQVVRAGGGQLAHGQKVTAVLAEPEKSSG